MSGAGRTKEQMMKELQEVRQRIAELEASNARLKRDETELILERNRVQSILDAMEDGVTIRDLDYNLTYHNQVVTRLYGDSIGKKCYRVFQGLDEPCPGCPVELAFRDGGSHTSVRRVALPSGEITFWKNVANPIRDARGEITSCVEINTNVTERILQEQAIKRKNEFLDSVLCSLSHPLYVINASDYTVKMANRAAKLGSLSKAPTCYALTHKSDKPCADAGEPCPLEEVKKSKKPAVMEHLHYDEDGNATYVEVHGYPILDTGGNVIQMIEYNLDITERKRLEEQLFQAQKMEAVGRLASGIAHDFNNLLTTILGHTDLMLMTLRKDNPLLEDVEEIRQAADRAVLLTRQLLAFSRKENLQPKVLDLNKLVIDLEKILRRLIGEDVELVTTLGAELGRVKADPGHMDQIIMNLAVNARDAMPEGGRLTIETGNVDLEENFGQQDILVEAGPYVTLMVSDTGVGMDRETQSRIFEPFFTTKVKDRGTGLGLSTVYGIVKQSGGHISVHSEPGVGTTFKIYLPRVEEEVKSERKRDASTEKLRGSETVLVVEDDEMVRKLTAGILEQYGYSVLEARDGEAALDAIDQHGDPIHMMVTDIIMPRMNGKELAEYVVSLRPKMKVLFVSGYPDNRIVQNWTLERGQAYLQKPFTAEKLADKVREVLGIDD